MECPTDFIVYCIEEYRDAYNLSGEETIKLFKKYDVLNYIRERYDMLHIEGGLAIAEDIRALTSDKVAELAGLSVADIERL
ncbi:hypothetical protein RsTz2092_11530 [Deferribacterales bacterium RsTz2092]|nr:hypothetical protein AGMMS49941_10680 [Deferribacterales bacterium]